MLIHTLSAHMIRINLNTIFYTHVEHRPTKTIYIKDYIQKQTHTHMHAHTHTHTHTRRKPPLLFYANMGLWFDSMLIFALLVHLIIFLSKSSQREVPCLLLAMSFITRGICMSGYSLPLRHFHDGCNPVHSLYD